MLILFPYTVTKCANLFSRGHISAVGIYNGVCHFHMKTVLLIHVFFIRMDADHLCHKHIVCAQMLHFGNFAL